MDIIIGIISQFDQMFDLKLKVDHRHLSIFHGCLIVLTLFMDLPDTWVNGLG